MIGFSETCSGKTKHHPALHVQLYMESPFIKELFEQHHRARHQVPASAICSLIEGVLELFFPVLANQRFETIKELEAYKNSLQSDLLRILSSMEPYLPLSSDEVVFHMSEQLPAIYHMLLQDADAIANGDPAAQSVEEVIRTYPGFKAVAIYRLAHMLHRLQVPLLPRILSAYAQARTGIDIHPGAQIGSHFCIDHGTGIVIGETCIIGDHVKIYQGVTLGALSVAKKLANKKRHPTIEHHVVIYANATILGGNTVVGAYSTIGGNVWLTESVPPFSKVYFRPQIEVKRTVELSDSFNFSI
ncbi:MAG: serine O-acetyltransferase [Hymenobacteraceae bacterium]|nr:serine O-acetyltransferase [Hymenobacteraceae bacterium]MDX5397135.1 serine O-acetyltransferase [Hymenobacteraceae bacterium]MDX5513213.1 serine O-acetyltransferase [Hymenobacteraceae bacterium]